MHFTCLACVVIIVLYNGKFSFSYSNTAQVFSKQHFQLSSKCKKTLSTMCDVHISFWDLCVGVCFFFLSLKLYWTEKKKQETIAPPLSRWQAMSQSIKFSERWSSLVLFSLPPLLSSGVVVQERHKRPNKRQYRLEALIFYWIHSIL